MGLFDRDRHHRHDEDIHTHEVHERPVMVRERDSGPWGWLTGLLLLLLVAAVLWATGIIDIDVFGSDQGEGVRGGASIEVQPPDEADNNLDLDPGANRDSTDKMDGANLQ